MYARQPRRFTPPDGGLLLASLRRVPQIRRNDGPYVAQNVSGIVIVLACAYRVSERGMFFRSSGSRSDRVMANPENIRNADPFWQESTKESIRRSLRAL